MKFAPMLKNNMTLAPIVLFVYNRPWHTRQTVEALQKNELAGESDLYIFSDAPKKPNSVTAVMEVREYIRRIDGFRSISIIEQVNNLGLAKSIIDGVTRISNEFERVIVLEDDLVTSRYFLRYMNEGLDLYLHEENVISIHGYIYPFAEKLPETFFLRGADSWGWATWKRGWALFKPEGIALLQSLKEKHLEEKFNFGGSIDYMGMLRSQVMGKNNSWAVRWYASAFLENKLTLYPGVSLINNIGVDGTGEHCSSTNYFDCEVSKHPIDIKDIPVTDNEEVRWLVGEYLRNMEKPIVNRIKNKIRRIYNTYY